MIRPVIAVVLAVAVLAFVLSFVAGVAYIYTFCMVAAVIVCGHLVTLDDDYPGGWSNLDGDKEIWQSSLKALAVKVVVLIALLLVALYVPTISDLGA